jgi:methylmalonyl-CoA mutase N-terminal domain/subunit
MKIDDSIQKTQIDRLTQFKLNRDQNKVNQMLALIIEKSATSDNLMPIVIEAVEAHCTLGEIAHALRSVWGEYR